MIQNSQQQLYIVGIGPGSPEYLSKRAIDVLESVQTVAGYTTYIDLIRPLISGKEIVSTGMMKEVDRVEAAIDIALSGKSCAIVSSGDPGIYAMAGLALEICQKKNIPIIPPRIASRTADISLLIEVVPGISALSAGASLLGAPLTHDFAVISLSDLLTSWEKIEERIEAAAKADFVIVIYNPKSKKRDWQLKKAQEIILKYRNPETPVGIVASAMREGQRVEIVNLEYLHTADVDMQTTVFIGNSTSVKYLDFMITPRGYSEKYSI
jgi:precorrin-3B C17-methyltransferase